MRTPALIRLMAALAATLLLGACAAPPGAALSSELTPGHAQGWRRAELLRVGPRTEMPAAALARCEASGAGAPVEAERWALLRYRQQRLPFEVVVPLPAGEGAQPGQAWLVNVQDCRLGLRAPPARMANAP